MTVDRYSGLIEAVLFYENEIVSIDKIVKYTGLTRESVSEILKNLIQKYNDKEHGIFISEIADGYTFQIKKEIFNDIKELYNLKGRRGLSKTVMTVLSIIAYKQPITKPEIEDIRGVNSDNPIRQLLERNLIQITGRKDVLGKPLMYGTTKEFLKYFNLKSIKDLPQLNELKSEEFVPDGE